MNVYEVITSRILEQLESGVVPWRRPWEQVESKNVATGASMGPRLFRRGNQSSTS